MKNFVYRNVVGLLLGWIIFIFALCATPGAYIPSGDWLDLLSIDKLIHALMFFVLCVLFSMAAIKFEQSKLILTVYFMLSVLYGISLEVMQGTLFQDRAMDWKDMVANTFGCVIALIFYNKLKLFVREGQWKKDRTT